LKTLTPEMQAHIAEDVTRLATCWRLQRTDGGIMGFTDHDRDLTVDGEPYCACTGMTPTNVTSSSGLAVDNLDVESVLEDNRITEADIAGGLYDGAEIRIFQVDWQNPDDGKINLRRGTIGNITIADDGFVAEQRSMMQALQHPVGSVVSPSCPYEWGRDDGVRNRCQACTADFLVSGTVTGVTDWQVFQDTGRTEADRWFAYGLLTWQTGNNAGKRMEVSRYLADGTFTLFQPMPKAVQVGDTYQVYAGCDKAFATCRDKFNAAHSFGGYPHLPGNDKAFRYA